MPVSYLEYGEIYNKDLELELREIIKWTKKRLKIVVCVFRVSFVFKVFLNK